MKACIVYRRPRLRNLFKAVWVGYDNEFQRLESSIDGTRKQVEKIAVAQHVQESRLARDEQQTVNQVLLQAGQSYRQKELTTWLSPITYDANYFIRDQEAARASYHPNTCRWVLDKKEFQEWSNNPGTQGPLWIYAKPGAGKTILSSFLIDHYQSLINPGEPRRLFYFFCKNTDPDKNKPIAVVRSLLYQLYEAKSPNRDHISTQIGDALDKSGQQKATDYSILWELFCIHAFEIQETTIVIDALDECQSPEILIHHLIELCRTKRIRVIFTSRWEAHLVEQLDKLISFEISRQDINDDIKAFIEANVARYMQKFESPLRKTIVAKLSEVHEGMFLWVELVLKELKRCPLRSGVERIWLIFRKD